MAKSSIENGIKVAEETFKALKDDWDKLSNTFKFCLLSGGLSITAGWLIKPSVLFLHFYVFRYGFALGVQELSFILFFIFVCVIPALSIIWVGIKIMYFRWRYPIGKLGDRFIFSSIEGTVFIHDHKHKSIRWVESAKTALDLGYYPSVWLESIQGSKRIQKEISDPGIINLDKYRLKHGIRTRGQPFKKL